MPGSLRMVSDMVAGVMEKRPNALPRGTESPCNKPADAEREGKRPKPYTKTLRFFFGKISNRSILS